MKGGCPEWERLLSLISILRVLCVCVCTTSLDVYSLLPEELMIVTLHMKKKSAERWCHLLDTDGIIPVHSLLLFTSSSSNNSDITLNVTSHYMQSCIRSTTLSLCASSQFNSPHAFKSEHLELIIVWMRLTGVLPSDRVVMLIDMLIFSEEEEREGGEGLLFSTSCLWRKSRHARWILGSV